MKKAKIIDFNAKAAILRKKTASNMLREPKGDAFTARNEFALGIDEPENRQTQHIPRSITEYNVAFPSKILFKHIDLSGYM